VFTGLVVSTAAGNPRHRPTNYARNLFHIGSAVVAILALMLAPTRACLIGLAGAFFAAAWSMELARRLSPRANDRLMALFGRVAHPHEREHVNSSTWYATALIVLAVGASRPVAIIAVGVLGIADPVAALWGRRFGRTRLRTGRSLEGSLGFVVAGGLTAFAVASALLPGGVGGHVLLALIAGLTGAVAELLSTRLDDNLTIPLAVATSVTAALALFPL
jgi:dolichol kinase